MTIKEARAVLGFESEAQSDGRLNIIAFQQISADEFRKQASYLEPDDGENSNEATVNDICLSRTFFSSHKVYGRTYVYLPHVPFEKIEQVKKSQYPESSIPNDSNMLNAVRYEAAKVLYGDLHEFTITADDIELQSVQDNLCMSELSPRHVVVEDDIFSLNPTEVTALIRNGNIQHDGKILHLDPKYTDAERQHIEAMIWENEASLRRDMLEGLITQSDHHRYGKSALNFFREYAADHVLTGQDYSAIRQGFLGGGLQRGLKLSDILDLLHSAGSTVRMFDKTGGLNTYGGFISQYTKEIDIGEIKSRPSLQQIKPIQLKSYRVIKEMASILRRRALQKNIDSVRHSHAQESFHTATFIPPMGLMGPEEWQILTQGKDLDEQNNLIKIYQALLMAFNVNPSEQGWGVKLLKKIEYMHRLRAHVDNPYKGDADLDGQNITNTEGDNIDDSDTSLTDAEKRRRKYHRIRIKLRKAMDEVGLPLDDLNDLSVDINNFERVLQEQTLPRVVQSHANAARMAQPSEVYKTRVSELVMMICGMYPNNAKHPDYVHSGKYRRPRVVSSARRIDPSIPAFAFSKLLQMIHLADTNTIWDEAIHGSVYWMDRLVDRIKADDDEGQIKQKMFMAITPGDRPQLRLFHINEIPQEFTDRGVTVDRFKTSIIVDGKHVWVVMLQRDKAPLSAFRKGLTITDRDPMYDIFGRILLVGGEPETSVAGRVMRSTIFQHKKEEWIHKAILAIEKALEEEASNFQDSTYVKERRKSRIDGGESSTGRSSASKHSAEVKFYHHFIDGLGPHSLEELQLMSPDTLAKQKTDDYIWRRLVVSDDAAVGMAPLLVVLRPQLALGNDDYRNLLEQMDKLNGNGTETENKVQKGILWLIRNSLGV